MSSKVFGGTTATLIWVPIMQEAHKRYAVPQPDREVASTNTQPFATSQDVQHANSDSEKDNVDNMAAPGTPPATPDNGDVNNSTDNPPTSDPNDLPDSLPPVEKLTPVKPKPKPKPIEYVTEEVCADSHELATMYCPETVMRTYVKGQEPKKYCHIHGPK